MTESYPFSAWLNTVRGAIGRFADIEYQRRFWVRGEGPECDSFVEAMCHLFDDISFEDFLEITTAGKLPSTNQMAALNNFKETLDSFDRANLDITEESNVKDALIVNHPQWPEVCDQATAAVAALAKDGG